VNDRVPIGPRATTGPRPHGPFFEPEGEINPRSLSSGQMQTRNERMVRP